MRAFIFLVLISVSALSFCGCARNEAELQDGITNMFDYVLLPAHIFTRQIDNGLDSAVNLDKRPKK